MSSLTTLAAVKAFTATTSNGSDALITSLIDRESALIEEWCGRTFGGTANESAKRLNGSGTRLLPLPKTPVLTVSSVAIGNTDVPESDGTSWGWLLEGDSALLMVCGSWPQGRQNVVVSYEYGYANVPGPIEQACIEMVALDMKQRDNIGVTQKTLGGETITYSNRGMTDSVKEMLQPYRKVAMS